MPIRIPSGFLGLKAQNIRMFIPIKKNKKLTAKYLDGAFLLIIHSKVLEKMAPVIAIPDKDAR